MSNLRAYVMNSKVQGESFSAEVDGKTVRDTSVFTCEGQRFILQTKPKQLAEILVENVAPQQVKRSTGLHAAMRRSMVSFHPRWRRLLRPSASREGQWTTAPSGHSWSRRR